MSQVLLAIDVGNTHTVIGVYAGDRLIRHVAGAERSRTHRRRVRCLAVESLSRASELADPPAYGHHRLLGGAPMTKSHRDLCRDYFRSEPLVVGPGIKTGMPILYDNPKEVGADRIVNAVAAYERYREVCIVVDFGTATTFDCVSGRGEYLGGVITPGVGIALDALVTRTAKLPRVELVRPPKVVARLPSTPCRRGWSMDTPRWSTASSGGYAQRSGTRPGDRDRRLRDHAGAGIDHDRGLRRVLDPGRAPAHSSSEPLTLHG